MLIYHSKTFKKYQKKKDYSLKKDYTYVLRVFIIILFLLNFLVISIFSWYFFINIFYRLPLNKFLAIATYSITKTYSFSVLVFTDKYTINKYLSNCTHRKYSFSPLRAPDLQNTASPEYIVEFSTPCMRIETKPPVRLALFADYETRQNISICLYIWLVRCIGNTAPRAPSVPREISTPLRKRDGSWIRRSRLRFSFPRITFVILLLMIPGNGTLNVSMIHDTSLWIF